MLDQKFESDILKNHISNMVLLNLYYNKLTFLQISKKNFLANNAKLDDLKLFKVNLMHCNAASKISILQTLPISYLFKDTSKRDRFKKMMSFRTSRL